MEYTYRFKSFDGKHLVEKKKDKSGKAVIRLTVCAVVASLLCAARLVFPDETTEILANLGITDRYEKAVHTLGKVMSGEEELRDVWEDAFETREEDVTGEDYSQSADTSLPETYEEVFGNTYEEPVEIVFDETEIPTDGTSYDEAVVNAFKEKQSAYEKYGVPKKATYEMPELDFNYVCPVDGPVTSEFGYRIHPNDKAVRFHYGTDIGVPEGTEISTFADGVVKAVGNSSSYGKYVMIQHDGDAVTMYAHCSKICVSEGTEVLKGDKIAESGSTGNATGDCVHFELIVDEKYVNPEYYISWS